MRPLWRRQAEHLLCERASGAWRGSHESEDPFLSLKKKKKKQTQCLRLYKQWEHLQSGHTLVRKEKNGTGACDFSPPPYFLVSLTCCKRKLQCLPSLTPVTPGQLYSLQSMILHYPLNEAGSFSKPKPIAQSAFQVSAKWPVQSTTAQTSRLAR